MGRQTWLNYAAVIALITLLALGLWWLLIPTPLFALRAQWRLKGFGVNSIVFSPRGNLLAVALMTQNKKLLVTLWQVPEKKAVKTISVSPKVQPSDFPRHQIAFSPDGHLLAVAYKEQSLSKVSIFSVTDGRKIRTITIGKSATTLSPSVFFAPDGRLIVGHDLSEFWFVQFTEGKKTRAPFTAQDIAFSPDARFIATVDAQAISIAGQQFIQPPSSVTIYDIKGRFIRQLKVAKASLILATTFSKDGQQFVCCWLEEQKKGRSFYARVWASVWRTKDWQLESSQPLTPFYDSTMNFLLPVIPSPDADLVILTEPYPANWYGLLWYLDFFVRKLSKQSKPMAPAGTTVRRLEDGELVVRMPCFGYAPVDFAFSPDGRYLAVSYNSLTPYNLNLVLWERKKQ